MNAALWLLIGLQVRGWLRYLLRSLRTLKGALLALVGLAVFVPWLLALVLAPRPGGGVFGHNLRDVGPALLLLYCFMNVVFSTGERAIYFPPAEVNFLFPGPFGRRELLGFKIVSTLIVSVPTALFMSMALRTYSTTFAASFVGMLLIVLFMQLFSMTINLLAISVGRVCTRAAVSSWRRSASCWSRRCSSTSAARRDNGSRRNCYGNCSTAPTWKIVSWPLRSFFDAVTAEYVWPDLAQSAAVGTLVNLFLVGVIFALDAQYLEAAAATSARIYARMKRLRRGGMGSGEGLRRGGTVRTSLPMLPWLGGIGPIAWRQLTTAAQRRRSFAAIARHSRRRSGRADARHAARRTGERAAGARSGRCLADAVHDNDAAFRFSRRHRPACSAQVAALAALACGDRATVGAGDADDGAPVRWFDRRGLDLAAERLAFVRVLGLCRLRPADQFPAFRPG